MCICLTNIGRQFKNEKSSTTLDVKYSSVFLQKTVHTEMANAYIWDHIMTCYVKNVYPEHSCMCLVRLLKGNSKLLNIVLSGTQ